MIPSPRSRHLLGPALLGFGLALAATASAQTQIQLGGAEVSIGLGASLEFDDNVRASGANKDSDLILRGLVSVKARWDFSQYNYLSLGAEAGYRKYFDNSDLDEFDLNLDVTPGAGLRWNIKVGPATVVLREALSFSADNGDARSYDAGTGTVGNTPAQYRRFENRIGVDVSFDVRDGELGFVLERRDEIPLDDEFDYLRETVWTVGANLMVPLRSDLDAGAFIRYEDREAKNGVRNDGTRFEAGPQVTWRPSEVMEVSAAVYYSDMDFDTGGALADTSDSSGINWRAGLSHELTRDLSQRVEIARVTEYGQLSNVRKVRRASYGMDWKGLRWAVVRGDLTREEAEESGGLLAEDLDQWVFGVGLTSRSEGRISWAARLNREDRDSSIGVRTYTRHRLLFEVRYGF